MSQECMIRVRMSSWDARYSGGLVAGATTMGLFGDVATELAIRHDGDEGLLRAYENVEFLAPIYAGDFIEATGRIVKVGDTSRRIELEAKKVIGAAPKDPSRVDVLEEPVVVARAVGVTVVPNEKQRKAKSAT